MASEETEYEIVMGMINREHPADVLYMCYAVALMRMSLDEDFSYRELHYWSSRRSVRYPVTRLNRLLRGAGIVLCPIFDPLKHEELTEYREQMTETRLGYQGIASEPKVQFEFASRVREANESGAFESLRNANERRLWAQLRSGSEKF